MDSSRAESDAPMNNHFTVDSKNSANLLLQMNVEKRTKNIRKIFFAWSQSVTYHGFAKIFSEKTNAPLRPLWAFIFLSFSALTCYLLVSNVLSFYMYNVSTSVQIVDESPSAFPAITICNVNPFTTQAAEELLEQLALDKFALYLANMSYSEYQNHLNDLIDYAINYVNVPEYGDAFRQQLGFNLSEVNVLDCEFQVGMDNL